jgi:Right handed beta helix region
MKPGCPLMAVGAALCTLTAAGSTLYVSPEGDDAWSGRLQGPSAARTDGPLASLRGARDAVRRMKALGPLREPVHVLIAPGSYTLVEPFVLTPEDNGTAECPITYEAVGRDKPVFSGGRRITGFRRAEDGTWVAEVPEVREGRWYPEQLFVNGQRATRARSPNRFYYYIARAGKPYDIDPATGQPADLQRRAFVARPEDVKPLLGLSAEELNDVNVVVYYAWESARLRPASVEAETSRVVTTGPGAWRFGWLGRERYLLENLRAALDEPGEWFLSRDGKLSCLPRPGEEMQRAVVVAPVVDEFVRFVGEPAAGLFVEHVALRGLAFEHAGYRLPPEGHSDGQAAVSIPAVIMGDGCRSVTVERCRIAHTGTYGLWFRRGCRDCAVRECWFEDLGAGGVKIGEPLIQAEEASQTHAITCDNNIIHGGGRLFTGAVGVWVGQSSDNQVTHNDISDLYYTGISVGWSWGYADTICKRNRIESNHIHHLGWGVMSDMGGVYTLGVSDGTTVSNNVIHDITSYNRYGYGGLGLYNDEGTTHITMENNLVYDTLDMTYHQHYGRENTVRNNILVDGRNFQISVYRPEPHLSATFENNIVCFHSGKLFWAQSLDDRKVSFSRNLYWNAAGDELSFMGLPFSQWQALGQDTESLIADPKFVDPANHDFRLQADSPALKLGFRPFDASRAGLYGDPEWVKLPGSFVYPPVEIAPDPPPAPPLAVDDDFELTPVGAPPADATVQVENVGSIAVTDEVAATGAHSLKIVDAPGQKYSFNPHFFYVPHHTEGTTTCTYDIRIGEGAEFWHQWRDNAQPYRVGPTVTIRGGKLLANDKPVLDMPVGQWVHIEVTATLGARSAGTWDLAVTLPGADPQRFVGLPNGNADWKSLDWIGFVSNAQIETVIYLDNIRITNDA